MPVNSAKEDEQIRDVPKRVTLLRMYRYLFAYKKELILVGILLLVVLAVSLILPLLIEVAVDVYVANRDVSGLLRLAAFALAALLLFWYCKRRSTLMMENIVNRVLLKLRGELYAHIQTLSFRFYDSRPTGKILARVVGDVNSLKEMLSDSVTKLLPDLLTVIGVAAIMLAKNWQLALAVLVTLPFLCAGMFGIQFTAHKRWQIHRQKNSNLNAFIHENFSGIRLIQSFAAEPERQSDFDRSAQEFTDSFAAAVRMSDLFGALVEISWGAGAFLLYYIGIRVVGADKVGVGTFLAFSTYLGMFWNPIQNLASFYNKIVTNISAAERIFDMMDTPADIADRPGAAKLPPVRGEVRFEHVSFTYGDDSGRNVLEDVSFTVRPGERIALVGPTGAGKTTIVNLIGRFYDVTGGRVTIDGQDVRDVTLKSLRTQVGMMTQDTFLFTGTVRENICYGKLKAEESGAVETSGSGDAAGNGGNASAKAAAAESCVSAEKMKDAAASCVSGEGLKAAAAESCVSAERMKAAAASCVSDEGLKAAAAESCVSAEEMKAAAASCVSGEGLKAAAAESCVSAEGMKAAAASCVSSEGLNAAAASPAVSDEQMIAAAKAVNAHDFIMRMEKGYDTPIGERGGQISIGQRQLIAFARTMVSDPRILILDEATSSIDTHTERLVQAGIEAMLKNRTSFTIAHRLSTIRNADRIFYVDQKGILEMGSHEELLKKKGYYWHLYQSQSDLPPGSNN